MIYASTREEIEKQRRAFLRKWRARPGPVADSLEEAGGLFTFTRLPASQWKSARTTNAIERLHEEFQTTHQDPDGAAFVCYCRHAVLGTACFRPDHHAQGRRMANAGNATFW
jgi:hypothetical protein